MATDCRSMRAGACSLTLSAALCLAAHAAGAVDLAYETSLGLGHSDNIRRTASAEEDESLAAAGLRFSLDQRSKRLTADVVGDVAYTDYLGNTYNSEVLGNLAGNARFGFVPQRFEWVVTDNFGQVLADPFTPATPDNRENINYFTTGPDVTLAFGSQTRLRLGARYSLATYEKSPLDFDSVSEQLSLIRQLSSASSVSLSANTQSVDYDDATLNADYDQSELYVSYDVTGARTHLKIDAGYTEVNRDAASNKENGLLLRLDVSRRVSAASTVALQAGREFANSGTAFASSQDASNIGLQAISGIQAARPFTNDYVTLGWNFVRPRTAFSLSASLDDQSYDGASQLDQKLSTLTAQLRRELSPKTSVAFSAAYGRGQFEVANSDYDDLNGEVSFSWKLTRHVSLSATYDYFDRSSDRPDAEFTENRYWLSIAYGSGTPRGALLGPAFGVDQIAPQTTP